MRLEQQTAGRGEDRYQDGVGEDEEEPESDGDAEDYAMLDALDTAAVYREMYDEGEEGEEGEYYSE